MFRVVRCGRELGLHIPAIRRDGHEYQAKSILHLGATSTYKGSGNAQLQQRRSRILSHVACNFPGRLASCASLRQDERVGLAADQDDSVAPSEYDGRHFPMHRLEFAGFSEEFN